MQCTSVLCFLPPLGRAEARRSALAGRGLRERKMPSAQVLGFSEGTGGVREEAKRSVSQPSWHP